MASWKISKNEVPGESHVQEIGLFHFARGDDFVRHLRVLVVCVAGPGAGDFHGNLDSLDLLLRHLLQAGRADGEKEMMSVNLLACGVIVFTLVLIGLWLTVMEFRNLK